MLPHRLLIAIEALGVAVLSATAFAKPLSHRAEALLDATSLTLLSKSADAQVQSVIDSKSSLFTGTPRGVARAVRRLAAPFVWPNSTYYHDETLLPHIEEMLAFLVKVQHSDGTYSVGNRHSPPDTGFLIEDFGITVRMLEQDDHNASQPMADTIRVLLVKAGRALATGGIHTPNHRWKICGALARISRITNDETLIPRIDEWLAEGIDIDSDGIYSERSPNYYSAVTNPSLLTVAHELNRTELISYVRKNLELSIEHAEPNAEMETILSRRQDQAQPAGINMVNFYLQFRELALLDGNGRFASIVRLLEARVGGQLGDFLGDLIERPELGAPLPELQEPFVNFSKHYSNAGLVRSRRGKLTTSVFGGSDWYNAEGAQTDFFNRFGSGLSTNPTMFRAWNGASVLEAVRLVPNFFTMGHFRSNGITYNCNGISRLGNELEVPYFLPMPAEYRDPNGVYELSRAVPDGRFYAMLDFEKRPASMRRLRTNVTVAPTTTGYDLTFEVTGESDVELTFELTFRVGGTMVGGEQLTDVNGVKTYHLVEGTGEYRLGNDTITFGPGNGKGLIQAAPGEQYSWLGGSLKLEGHQVYITGTSPLKYTLKLGFS
jgi:hypothetical protein